MNSHTVLTGQAWLYYETRETKPTEGGDLVTRQLAPQQGSL